VALRWDGFAETSIQMGTTSCGRGYARVTHGCVRAVQPAGVPGGRRGGPPGRGPGGRDRRDLVQAGCPDCGVLPGRVHQRTRQRLRDVPVAGPVEVVPIRRRIACLELACARRTFTEVSDEVPPGRGS
jgi:hypothetical protein